MTFLLYCIAQRVGMAWLDILSCTDLVNDTLNFYQ